MQPSEHMLLNALWSVVFNGCEALTRLWRTVFFFFSFPLPALIFPSFYPASVCSGFRHCSQLKVIPSEDIQILCPCTYADVIKGLGKIHAEFNGVLYEDAEVLAKRHTEVSAAARGGWETAAAAWAVWTDLYMNRVFRRPPLTRISYIFLVFLSGNAFPLWLAAQFLLLSIRFLWESNSGMLRWKTESRNSEPEPFPNLKQPIVEHL